MTDPAKLTIRRNFPRPAPEEIEPFRSMPTGWIVDALGRRGALPHYIRPISREAHFVGPALTVRTRLVDNLAPCAALRFAVPGDVLVVATDGAETASVVGDVLLGMAKNAGVAALVTDGLVRDVDGINQVGIPVFARALSPNSPFKDGPGEIGLPVTLGNMLVQPGDLLIGDNNGVVVVPRARLVSVASELKAIAERERQMEEAVAAGSKYPRWLDDFLNSDKVFYLD